MPTIDQLEAALAAGDSDEVPASQGGVVRRISRAQLVAGMQPTLALASGTLLGRATAGTGGPESIAVGSNLNLSQGRLDATVQPFMVAAQPLGTPPGIADLVAVAQSGLNQALPYQEFMAGLSTLAGLDISQLAVVADGTSSSLPLSTVSSAFATLEAFGAVGDGTTDDTAALLAAAASGLVIRLGPKAYKIAGSPVLPSSCTLVGIPGISTLRGSGAPQWLALGGPAVTLRDVIFDASGGPGVVFQPSCVSADVRSCRFVNGTSGLSISGASGIFSFDACTFSGNALAGLTAQLVGVTLRMSSCQITQNTSLGVSAQGIVNARISGCNFTKNGNVALDIAASLNSDIFNNIFADSQVAINCGGGAGCRISSNRITNASVCAIRVRNVERSTPTQSIEIARNSVSMTAPTSWGVVLLDGPLGVTIRENDFYGSGGASLANTFACNTDVVSIARNRWNLLSSYAGSPTTAPGGAVIQYPDILDDFVLSAGAGPILSLVSMYQYQAQGGISFIRVLNSGSAYSFANISIAGSGSGASATALLSNGALIGVIVTAPGSGYGSIGTSVPIVVSGDGAGAAAIGYASPPVPSDRRLRLSCTSTTRFVPGGPGPSLSNWTSAPLTIPPLGFIEWRGNGSAWQAAACSATDLVQPDGSGGTILRSQSGSDVQIRISGPGHLRVTSDAETTGCQTAIGRGAPEGIITAPPGSLWHNLNGGVGTTLYVKRSGTGNTGWFALG